MSDKQPKRSGRGANLPNGPGHGRTKGSQNKITKSLKEMILGALESVGGQEYLAEQAATNPGPFLALIGKVLPTTIQGGDGTKDGEPVSITVNLHRVNEK